MTELAMSLERPQAVLVISPYREMELPKVSTASQLETIHDFGGFYPAFNDIQYPASGNPQAAEQVVLALYAAGLPVRSDPQRGRAFVRASSLAPPIGESQSPCAHRPGQTMAVFLRSPDMLEWIAERIATPATPEQAQAAFDGLVQRGVLRRWLHDFWELETSDPELPQWLLGIEDQDKRPPGGAASP